MPCVAFRSSRICVSTKQRVSSGWTRRLGVSEHGLTAWSFHGTSLSVTSRFDSSLQQIVGLPLRQAMYSGSLLLCMKCAMHINTGIPSDSSPKAPV